MVIADAPAFMPKVATCPGSVAPANSKNISRPTSKMPIPTLIRWPLTAGWARSRTWLVIATSLLAPPACQDRLLSLADPHPIDPTNDGRRCHKDDHQALNNGDQVHGDARDRLHVRGAAAQYSEQYGRQN